MLFSVIVPCYNSKDFLRDCLDSILAQTISEFEIVAIDDGSTDETAQILDEYAAKFNCIHVYHFKNAGVAHSRRRGITLASGDYIVFVDSDDTINPDLLCELDKAVRTHDFPDIIRYQANMVHDAEHKDHERYNFTKNLSTVTSGMEALRMWSTEGKKYAVYWLFAFKVSVFSKFMFCTTLRCYEDVALIPILIAVAPKVVTIGYIGYNYTCDNTSSLTNFSSISAESQRADFFYQAYLFAVQNFTKLEGVSSLDIAFFVEDYTRRLRGKFDSLPEQIQPQFEHWFK